MTRKVALERYLEKLAKNPDMCKSREFLHFICSDEIYRLVEQHVFNSGSNEDLEAASGGGKGMRFVKNILTNVDESMDGFIQKFKLSSQGGGSGNIGGVTSSAVSTALGMMNPNNVWLNIKATTMGRNNRSPVGGNLISSTARDGQSLSATGGGGGGVMFGAPSLQQNGSQYSSEGGGGGAGLAADADAEIEVTSTDIIVDIFQEVFQLKEKNNWLRRGAVLLIVQQLFGGTVDRRVTEQVKWVFSRENVIYVLERIKESLWPGGKWWSSSAAEGQQKQQQQPPAPRTIEEKLRSKLKAKGNVVQLVPELLGGVVGRQNAKRGAERLFFILQNRRLNQHLIYKLFDELSAQLMA